MLDSTKVENPKTGGDVTRSWKLTSEDSNAEISAYFASVNFGKKHLFLDLEDKTQLEAQELNNINSSRLATLMNVSRQRVFQWRKQENMKLHTVQGLCKIFDLTLDQFCQLKGE